MSFSGKFQRFHDSTNGTFSLPLGTNAQFLSLQKIRDDFNLLIALLSKIF
jgi:hypothetical protein